MPINYYINEDLYIGGSGKRLKDIIDTMPIGTILPYSSITVPSGYMLCDGRAISRTIYKDLFDIIGTTYGSGDGSTTFNLPNLKGKVPVGLDGNDTSFDEVGKTGGEKTHTLTIAEMPSHKHDLYVTGGTGAYSGLSYSTNGGYNPNFTRETGGGQAHNIMQPYTVLVYIIKVAIGNATIPESVTITNADVLQITQNKNDITSINNRLDTINIYSTDEVRIGTWFGKPLYRKCQTGTKTNTSEIHITLNVSDVDTFVMVKALTPRTATGTEAGTTNEYYNRSNDMIGTYLYSDNGTRKLTLRQGDGWPVTPYNYVIVMEYTKTTD